MKIKYSRSEQEIGLRHKTEHTNDSFKRILASFYRSYSKIWVLNSRKKSLLKTKQKNTQKSFSSSHTRNDLSATGKETLAHKRNNTLMH